MTTGTLVVRGLPLRGVAAQKMESVQQVPAFDGLVW
jgi:hypothetical protein